MDLSVLTQYLSIVVVGICLCVGFVIKNSLVAGAAIVLIALLMAVVASITSIIPSVSLKSDDKELARTYEHITKLDAELTD